jgi:hypothetical protein
MRAHVRDGVSDNSIRRATTKTIVAISVFAFLVATSAFGKTAKVPTNHVDPYDIH